MTRLALIVLVATLAAGCGNDAPAYGAKPTGGTFDADPKNAPALSDTPDSGEDIERTLLGAWTYSTFIGPDRAAELSDEPLPAGVEVDLAVEGSSTFHRGGRYDADARIVFRVRQAGEEVPLRVLRREAGTWEVIDGVIVQTVENGTLTALDDLSQAIMDESPDFAAFLAPIAGETESTEVLSYTEDSVDLQEETSELRYTLRRQ